MSRVRSVSHAGVKLILNVLLVLVFIDIFVFLIAQIADGRAILWPLVGLWLLAAYIILPRIHRFLTKIYIPNYFVGRTRTGDGFYGDPVNLALIGSEEQLHQAMTAAGWARADDLSLQSSLKMTYTSLRKKSYPEAPVSSLYLFSEKQDFAYQKEVNGNPRVRHHVRFWQTPEDWWLPGGHEVDWLGAATFDRRVGLSLYTGQITHKIDDNTDEERDHVVKTMKNTKHVKDVEVVEHFTTAFRSRNGGGDRIETDGSLPFIYLK
ncbi:LssY C-terminal domain-containing protein [Candidatus Saccharibacteria bacterium]|nr:LssY C-terminal domain-containing protein [Candidatus Saccharibacteria bacterium]